MPAGWGERERASESMGKTESLKVAVFHFHVCLHIEIARLLTKAHDTYYVWLCISDNKHLADVIWVDLGGQMCMM